MAQVVPRTIGESLYWSYAQMVMAWAAAREERRDSYRQIDFIVRSRTYYGLLRGRLKLGSLLVDEREKIASGRMCAYCGIVGAFTLDHLIPRLRGGGDAGDNLVAACRSCNSSKGGRDLLVWTLRRGEWPTMVLIRRYLKLAIRYSVRHGLMGVSLADAAGLVPPLPFELGGVDG